MSDVIWIEGRSEFQDLIDTEDQVVVDFTAPSWCGPCQKFAPHFEAAAESARIKSSMLGRTTFVAVDVDSASWATVDYGVRGVPTVKLFRKGQFVADLVKNPQDKNAPKLLKAIESA